MAELREQFLSCRQRYEDYRRSHPVPQMIDLKLQLLVSCINKSPCQSNLDPLTIEEREYLEKIDVTSQIRLFTSIASCLMGDGAPNKVKEALIRRDRMFASWEPCYISYDAQNVYITRKTKEIVPIANVRVSTTVKEKSRRFVFALEMQGTRYHLSLPTPEQAREIAEGIVNARHQQPAANLSPERPSEIVNSKIESPQDYISPVSSEEALEPQLVGQFNLENLQFDDGYKIIESLGYGRVLVDQNQPNCTKLVMLIESSNLQKTLELYCHFEQWNPSIENHTIVNRLGQNVYLVYEKYKQCDLTSRPRDFLLVRAAVKRGERLIVVEKSVEHPNFVQGHSTVRGKIQQRVTAFIPHPQNQQAAMLVVRMQADFGGFNSVDDNVNMAMIMLKNIACFKDYSLQKELLQTEVRSALFCFRAVSLKSPQPDPASLRRIKSQPVRQQQMLALPPPVQLIDIIQQYESDPLTETYLDLVVTQQKQLELPLKHRYSFDVRPDQGRSHVPTGPGNFIFQNDNWRISEDGEFVFLNQQVINAQKDVLKWIISQVCSNIIRGKSLVNMSMPVDIFDDRSMLERNACCFGYAPIFLKQAGMTSDEVQQIRLIMAFVLSQPTLELRQEKPFNPILGETFQGYLGGIPIFYEQTSHHPPISSFYMKCPEFELYGNLISYAEVGVNTGVGGNTGMIHIKFPKNDAHYEYMSPPCEIGGLILGERRFRVIGKGYVVERSKLLYGEMSTGKDKKHVYPANRKIKSSELFGGVFRVSPDFIAKYVSCKHKHKFEGLTSKDKYQQLSTISGAWNDKIQFDDRTYKSLFDPVPFVVQYQKHPLPSNCNYRQDIIYKRMKNLAMSQAAKQRMEELQRADKKLRQRNR